MGQIRINIPIKPLSVNAAFQGRRFKTKKCLQYERTVFYYLPNNEKIKGDVCICYRFYLKNYKKTDADNLIKVLQDCLVKKGIIDDDRKVICYVIYKFPSETDYIQIIIKPYKDIMRGKGICGQKNFNKGVICASLKVLL